MWVFTAPERPTSTSGWTPGWASMHIPPAGDILHGTLHGTKQAASRAVDRASDFAGHQLHNLDIGRAAYNAGCYARRRPDVAAGVIAGAAMLTGLAVGWFVKSLTCRGKHVRTEAPPVVEYYTASGVEVSGGVESVDH